MKIYTEINDVLDHMFNACTTSQISDLIFSAYVLPFWALSFVLLAAVIGAIVLARKD